MPPENKPDKETQKILTDGEALSNMLQSRGWAIAKTLLLDKILKVSDTMEIDTSKTATTIANEIKINNRVVKEMLEWMQELEGVQVQQREAVESLKEFRRNNIINYHEER